MPDPGCAGAILKTEARRKKRGERSQGSGIMEFLIADFLRMGDFMGFLTTEGTEGTDLF